MCEALVLLYCCCTAAAISSVVCSTWLRGYFRNPEERCIGIVGLPPSVQLIGPEDACVHTEHTRTHPSRLSQKEKLGVRLLLLRGCNIQYCSGELWGRCDQT